MGCRFCKEKDKIISEYREMCNAYKGDVVAKQDDTIRLYRESIVLWMDIAIRVARKFNDDESASGFEKRKEEFLSLCAD